MTDHRIQEHPVLQPGEQAKLSFFWKGEELEARRGEVIASALFANGIRIFGHHHKDEAPLGIFCANGQCAQCSVIADGIPVKSCMVPVKEGMRVEPLAGRAALPEVEADHAPAFRDIESLETECLIIGGGPAGLAAAIELGRAGVNVMLVDDKHALGGKLVLQTHKFFGSIDACHAGTRGMDIGKKLEEQVRSFENVRVWTETTAVG
ncbi:MAG: (2Fe-2S)-binding protein, partial [Myxococcota bacterium]